MMKDFPAALQSVPRFVAESLRRNADYLRNSQTSLTASVGTTDYKFWRDGESGEILGTATFRSGKRADVAPEVIAAAMG